MLYSELVQILKRHTPGYVKRVFHNACAPYPVIMKAPQHIVKIRQFIVNSDCAFNHAKERIYTQSHDQNYLSSVKHLTIIRLIPEYRSRFSWDTPHGRTMKLERAKEPIVITSDTIIDSKDVSMIDWKATYDANEMVSRGLIAICVLFYVGVLFMTIVILHTCILALGIDS